VVIPQRRKVEGRVVVCGLVLMLVLPQWRRRLPGIEFVSVTVNLVESYKFNHYFGY